MCGHVLDVHRKGHYSVIMMNVVMNTLVSCFIMNACVLYVECNTARLS